MATINWNGSSADWTTNADWGGAQPGQTDTATIASGAVGVKSNDSIQAGALNLTGGSITVANGGALYLAQSGAGNGYIASVTIGSNASFTVDGGTVAFGAYLNTASGTIIVQNGGSFQWNGAVGRSSDGVVGPTSGFTVDLQSGYLTLQQTFDGHIKDFGGSDLITFNGSITSESYSSNVLSVHTNANLTYNLNFIGTYTASNFSNGVGGYSISYVAPQTAPPAPTVNSVSVPSSGNYHAGQTLSFTANFSSAVNVTGTPQIAVTLDTGGTVEATYQSGTGSTGLVFHYTVLAGQQDANGITVGALSLNGGTIKDGSGTDASLALNSVGSTSGVDVQAILPVVSSIILPAAATNNASSESFTVNFSEGVTGVAAGDFTVTTTGGVSNTGVASITGSGSQYTVTVSGVTGDGTLGLTLKANSTGITDTYGNGAAAAYTGGPTYTVDHTAPSISSITLDKTAYKLGDTVTATIHLSGSYDGHGAYTLQSGGVIDGSALSSVTYNSTNNTLAGSFVVTGSTTEVLSGSVATNVTVVDGVGNQGASTTAISGVVIDTHAPTAVSVGGFTSGETEDGVTSINANASIANLTTTDASSGDSFTYTLSGADAGKFAIQGAALDVGGTALTGGTTYTFSITSTDLGGNSYTQNVSVLADQPPVVAPHTAALAEGGTASGTSGVAGSGALSGDSDPDEDVITITQVGGVAFTGATAFTGTYGALTLNNDGAYSYVASDTTAIDAATAGSHPTDSFTLTVSDGHPGGTTNETLSFSIDRTPITGDESEGVGVAESGTATGTGGVAGTGALMGASDPDGDTLTVTKVGDSAFTGATAFTGTYGVLTLNNDGSYSYAANDTVAIDGAATGSHPTDSFSLTVDDGHGGAAAQSLSFSIDRAPAVDDKPKAVSLAESGTATGTSGLTGTGALFGASDPDGDTLTVTKVGDSAFTGATAFTGTYGVLTLNNDGSYSYAASDTTAIDGAATGSHPTDSFSLTVDDGHGGTAAESLSFSIDRAPALADQSHSVSAATSLTETAANGALSADSDPDGGVLAISAVTPSGGTATTVSSSGASTISGSFGDLTIGADGHYTYHAGATLAEQGALASAATGSHPADSFALTVSDGGSVTANENLTFNLERSPVAPSDSDATTNAVTEGAAASTTVGLTAASTDPDGDSLTYSVTSDSSGGGFTVDASTGVVSVADPTKLDYATSGSTHSYTVEVTASDGTLSAARSFTIGVNDVAPAISGAVVGQTTTDKVSDTPFSAMTITETGSATQQEAVTVTLSNAANGVFTAASLTASGFVADGTTAGRYDYTGTAAQDTAAIAQLVFQPTANQVTPAQTVTTTFTVDVGDGTLSASDDSTTVIATSVNDPPSITGAVAHHTLMDTATVRPFAGVTVSDPDVGQTESVTVSLSADGNGRLSNAGPGVLDTSGTSYTVSGSAAVVTAALDQLVFNPNEHQLAGGQMVTTGFTISVSDGVASPVNDSTTTVTVTDTAVPTTDLSTPGNDVLTAVPGGDTILASYGDDTVTAGTGHDMLYGNAGNDVITLLSYTDASTVYGGQGDDVIDARRSFADNFMSGDIGNDSILAGSGADTLYGGDGDDTLVAGSGSDQLYGNAGNDHISLDAASGSGTVYGGQGNDVIDASASTHANFISGDLGDDLIHLGSGADTAYGGAGDDTIIGGGGHDQLYGNEGNDTLSVGVSNLGSTLFGGQGNDVIDASASTHANFISGDLGNDYILAGSGGDTIHGGTGSDTIQAASGAATYIHTGLADSRAVSAADASQLDHITHFDADTKLVFDGGPAGTAANTLFHGGDTAITDYAAAYAYAYGDATHTAAIAGAEEYAVVSDAAGHVYVFAADHAAIELDGLTGGVHAVSTGQILFA